MLEANLEPGGPARAAPRSWSTVAGESAAATVAFAAVAGLAADNGGYFPTTWGWASVALCGIGVVYLAVRGLPRLGMPELVVLAAIVGFSAWTFASSVWSISATRSMLEGERTLVYVGGVVVALLLTRRAGGRAVVVGTWLGITAVSVYALLTRLFPKQFGVFDPLAGNRLSSPVGYWNGLALLAVVGTLLALGLAARGALIVRMGAAASAVVLVLTLYFTFGRGAWIALIVGLLATVAVDRRRLQLLATTVVVGVWAAIAVYDASKASALVRVNVSLDAAQKDGHSVAVVVVFLMTFAAVAVVVLDAIESRLSLTPGRRLRWAVTVIVVVVVAAVASAGVARYGSPVTIARRAWHSFNASPRPAESSLNNRLFNLSGNGRVPQWRVAAREAEAHPLLGTGSGTFSEYWFQFRSSPGIVHDAHNLYLETLAETGAVGLALLVLLLGGLTVGAARSRSPLGAVAAGACIAYLLHAVADWDWELPALLLAVAFPALAVVEESGAAARISAFRRIAPAGVVVVIGAFALFALLGNIALARSENASDATRWRHAENEARSALGLVPWSAEPLRKLAVAQVGLGEIAAARDSLREAVGLEPRDWTLWYQLAEVSTGAERRRALARATDLNPKRTPQEAVPGDLRLVVIP